MPSRATRLFCVLSLALGILTVGCSAKKTPAESTISCASAPALSMTTLHMLNLLDKKPEGIDTAAVFRSLNRLHQIADPNLATPDQVLAIAQPWCGKSMKDISESPPVPLSKLPPPKPAP